MAAHRGFATQILQEMSKPGVGAAERLLPLVYDELRQLAAGYMRRERPDHTLEPTALVHEAFLKLIDQDAQNFCNRSHFLGVAASAMRQVLVNHALHRKRKKRGGGWVRVTLDQAPGSVGGSDFDVLALDTALRELEQKSDRLAKVVELRFFGGMTIAETAEALHVSHTTVEGDWTLAKAWLARELQAGDHE